MLGCRFEPFLTASADRIQNAFKEPVGEFAMLHFRNARFVRNNLAEPDFWLTSTGAHQRNGPVHVYVDYSPMRRHPGTSAY